MSLSALALITVLGGWHGVSRVDLLSEDPGTWLNYELPMIGAYPVAPAVRFATQVKVVWETPHPAVYVGTSLASQSVVYERAFPNRFALVASAGVQSIFLCPRGVMGGVAYRWKRMRLGLSLSAISSATWANLDYGDWDLVPSLGLGVELGSRGIVRDAPPVHTDIEEIPELPPVEAPPSSG